MSDHLRTANGNAAGGGLGAFQYLTIAIGCMIGIGWITVLGEWLRGAGVAGAILGFLLGGTVMAGVAACYAELSGMMPHSGGEVVFVDRVFGRGAAFLVGWFLVLLAAAVVSFEALSFVWIAQTLFGPPAMPAWYTVLGQPVTVPELLLGAGALTAMTAINAIGLGAAARAQDLLTVLKVVVMSAFIAAGLLFGDPAGAVSAELDGTAQRGTVSGVLWVAATAALWLGGFQVASQAAGERRSGTDPRTVGRVMTISVGIGVLFYTGVILAAASAAPVDDIVAAPLPAAYAAETVFRSRWGATAVLVAGLCGVLGAMNGMLISGTRLLVALARRDLIPGWFAGRDDGRNALLAVACIAVPGVLAGKAVLFPVVSTASLSAILAYGLMCAAAWRLRRTEPALERPFRVPGPPAVIACIGLVVVAMALALIARPFLDAQRIPVEWILLLVWAGLGAGVWLLRRRQTAAKRAT